MRATNTVRAVAAGIVLAVTIGILTGIAYMHLGKGATSVSGIAVIFAALIVIASITLSSGYVGTHRRPRERHDTPVSAPADALPAAAEATTEMIGRVEVAHEDPVHDDTVAITPVPAVKDEPTLLIPVAPKLGTVDVSKATHGTVEEFLGPDLAGCLPDGGVLVRGLAGDPITAHAGDRVGRDHEGVYVQCTEADRPLRGKVAVHGWATGELETVIIDLGKEAVA